MTQTKPRGPEAEDGYSAPTLPMRLAKSGLTWLLRYPMVAVLVVLLILTSAVDPAFWHLVNLENLLTQNVALLVVSVGVTFVLLGGGFDLSVGAIYAAAAIFYLSLEHAVPAIVGLLASVALGTALGAINGVIVNGFRINPFIGTLATSSVITGAMTIFYGDHTVYNSTSSYGYIGSKMFGSWLPLSFVIGLVIFVVGGFVLARSTFGRGVYAVGGNREAARLNGVRVGLISAATFTIVGAVAALGGVFTASQLGTAQPDLVGTVTLDAIAIVIIGGTSLLGGEGAMWRTGVGLAIIAVVDNLFSAENYNPSLQLVFKGLILLLAVGADVWLRRSART
jgi:ribose transport system permease protein